MIENGNEITDDKLIGDTCNSYFSQIGEKLATKIQQWPTLSTYENRRVFWHF